MPEENKSEKKPLGEKMKRVQRISISEDFEVTADEPIPKVPKGGARVKVCYAGACYTDTQVEKSGSKRPKMPGIRDTSLFPGFEVSGVLDAVCNTLEKSDWKNGDRVIVYPDNQEICDTGYAEYIIVKNIDNLIRIPDKISLEVASLLPSSALKAYSAVLRAKPFVEQKMKEKTDMTNVLIVGAGGLGMWTLAVAQKFIAGDCSKVHLVVADTSIEKLMLAKSEIGCADVIHWCDTIHEEYILMRSKSVCPEGVDVVIDFVSSPRTISRAMHLLNDDGVLIVGGNSKYEVSFDINSIANHQQSILGVTRGTRKQLTDLVQAFGEGLIVPPCYTVFPVEEANKVFEKLSQCKLIGRAVLKIGDTLKENIAEEEDKVFKAPEVPPITKTPLKGKLVQEYAT